jgi:hypothetical protein
MEQVYIIGKTNESGKTEFLDYVFKDYSESRKVARRLVDKRNKEIIFQNLRGSVDNSFSLLREISPDVWVCITETITIEVMRVKELMKRKKIKPHIVKEKKEEYITQEIMMGDF